MGFVRSPPSGRQPLGMRSALAVLGALLVSAVVYRLRLAAALHDPAAGWGGEPVAWRAMLRLIGSDAMLAVVTAALVMAVAQVGALVPRGRTALRLVGMALLVALLLIWGMICQSHQSTLLATGNGVTVELLRESMAFPALKEAFLLLLPGDIGFLLSPLLAFALLLGLGQRPRATAKVLFAGATVALLGTLLLPATLLPDSLRQHPIGFVVVDAWRTQRAHAAAGRSLATVASAQSSAGVGPEAPSATTEPTGDEPAGAASATPAYDEPAADAPSPIGAAHDLVLALPAPQFAHPDSERRIKKSLPPTAGQRPYNVVWILMESTGLDYALKPAPGGGGAVAMPFLKSLTERGYFLSNHFSAGNSSPRGIFSSLSGLYVMPEVAIFDVRKDVYLPSLVSYLGERYQRFLVTPASLDWYFPHAFLTHSGFSELWGYHALPVRKNAPGGRAHARDEADTVSFFLHRLSELTVNAAPFVAVYYSFIAHWPYPDYGDSTHLLKPVRPINNYYNNLRYLDQQIERIYNHLKQNNLLDNTILVFSGDHGEAFGQHQHNYAHSRASYNENYRTPALIVQPKLFPPRVFTAPTSHVDLLPTLLDALGVAYDPRRLQGESLYQDQFRRKYIFLYGNEDTVSSVSEDSIKLQISFKTNACWVFDLKADPEEKKPLSCQSHKEQQQALLLYRNNQRVALRRFNRETQEHSAAGSVAPLGQPVVQHARNEGR